MPAHELCLRFAIDNPDVSTIPIGCTTTEHHESSVAAARTGLLPNDILNRLAEIAALLPHRTFEEPMILLLEKYYVGPGIANMGAAIQVGKLTLANE